MTVQFSATPYAQAARQQAEAASLRELRAMLKGTVRTNTMGVRLGKLGIRWSSTSVRLDGQEQADSARNTTRNTYEPTPAARPRPASQPSSDVATGQTGVFTQAFTQALGQALGHANESLVMGNAFTAAPRLADHAHDAQDGYSEPQGQSWRSRRGQAAYAAIMNPAPAAGGLLTRTV